MKELLIATPALEVGAGIVLLVAPSVFARLLFGVSLDTAAALTVARIGGTGLLSLGVAAGFAFFDVKTCAARGVVSAMVLYNLGAAILLGAATSQPNAVAFVLWSGAGLHAALWCVASLLRKAPQSDGIATC